MQRLTADLLQTDTQPKVLGRQAPGAIMPEDSRVLEANRVRDQQTSIFEEARKLGHAEGLKDAEREIQKRVQEIETRLTQAHQKAMADLDTGKKALTMLLASIESAIKQHATDAETVAVEVAFASIIRLLGEKAADGTMMQDLCHVVANEYGHGEALLRVSEMDYSLFESVKMGLEIQLDRRLKSGQCVIETSRGQFASGIDVRLEALKKAFVSGLNQHRADI